jgi:hypothetical protein
MSRAYDAFAMAPIPTLVKAVSRIVATKFDVVMTAFDNAESGIVFEVILAPERTGGTVKVLIPVMAWAPLVKSTVLDSALFGMLNELIFAPDIIGAVKNLATSLTRRLPDISRLYDGSIAFPIATGTSNTTSFSNSDLPLFTNVLSV